MITGDNKLTAEAVCRSIGVFSKTEDVSKKSITGMEFKRLPAAEQREMLMVRGCTQHHSNTFQYVVFSMHKVLGAVLLQTAQMLMFCCMRGRRVPAAQQLHDRDGDAA